MHSRQLLISKPTQEGNLMSCTKIADTAFPDGNVRLTKLTEKGG